ncbi:MAG: glutamate-1-semialdehyde 2,1-aminomutase [Deltaproteobacteria bacterium]|nr:glutamate-1-semialdehyde 2,1-aminomutase [Candidatus Anaeroferrophillus wilburensis]MBN2889208.1 glutamate-1-semialdehyde 2,1-aminomutase [Deltaproteobacteria bacterium]
MKSTMSEKLFARAQKVIPGGVNSPVRAFRAVGLPPRFIVRGRGGHIFDADGNQYIDYVGSWGPLIIGHNHPAVTHAIKEQASRGSSFGAPTTLEIEMAELLLEALPSMGMVRMVNSGTEATMSAIRLARGATGRKKVIKFAGCYHGHVDALLVKAGSGATTLGVPDSSGVPAEFTSLTLSATYNDLASVDLLIDQFGSDIAAIIVEPIAGNMGTIPPVPGFLEGLRERCTKQGIVLIFDEVMTGFRVAYGGAQTLYNINPDLTCLGKIIGGGLPVGAFGGRREIMSQLAPLGSVYQAGTLSGNPLAMAAGRATLQVLKEENPYPALEEKAAFLARETAKLLKSHQVPHYCTRVGSMFCTYFTDTEVYNYQQAQESDTALFARYFAGMLERGIYLAPSQFEAGFLSAAHTNDDLEQTLTALDATLTELSAS